MEKNKMRKSMITLEQVKNHPDVKVYIKKANDFLGVIGYTEHGERHGNYVAKNARKILEELGYDANSCELAAIAGYIHDIGNVVSRHSHPEHSAHLASQFLKELHMPVEDRVLVMSAVGNHDEGACDIVSPVSAALIIADKSDVHRSRVRSLKEIKFDIHDRVNYAVTKSKLHMNAQNKTITLILDIDKEISDMVEYFEIFTARMVACRRAAKLLECTFDVKVNGSS
ncbi:MAG: HD domain-containing protein [Candidatus Brocadia sp. AMX2]|nr:MAG: HD domain-containing protein [Candidatus Brocadia sp. AMX2]MBC6931345.1 HD domain-containing protein [Candidatus Brocadia sp.]MBL1168692.1 HD domain-containing protein [Candidatus Brocadia sp. AMX1]NOG43292.1 HD domain-containing protein [Planctomycetota bacterium]MCE7866537.1 HD domain-containing protein [Candidatus Brocadia sp. AMX2]